MCSGCVRRHCRKKVRELRSEKKDNKNDRKI